MYRVRAEGGFAAAHFLERYHGKCENMHGHNYKVRVHAEGSSLDEGGMLIDFGVLKDNLREVLKVLDHSLLNDHADFADGNPSAEKIAKYIFDNLKQKLPDAPLSMVEVFETDRNMAVYLPD
jgi:6-pyruvoyltetrahydropterin/6-carboxytetrahydropterin synthase